MLHRPLIAAGLALASLVLASTGAHAQSGHCLEQRVELPGVAGVTSFHGTAVAADGEWLAVTAPFLTERVTLYRRSGDAWSEFQTIEPEVSFARTFGASVSISGTALAIGATDEDASEPGTGVVYVYRFDGSTWSLEDDVTTNHIAPRKFFGTSVAMSGDLLAVGAPAAPFAPAPFGSVELFVRGAGNNWDPIAYLTTNTDNENDLGTAVAISKGRVFASDPMAADEQLQEGAVHVFDFVAGRWQLTASLVASDAITLWELGRSIAADGDRVAAWAPGANAVYLYELVGEQWRERRKIDGPAGTGSFGFALAFENERLIASDPFEGGAGTVHVYRLAPQIAEEIVTLSHDSAGAQFGTSLAFRDGALYVGAPVEPLWGAAFVYPHLADAEPFAYCTPKQSSGGCLPSISSLGCPVAGASSGFQLIAQSLPNQKSAVLFYGTNGPAALPYQGGTLCIEPPVLRTIALPSGGNLPPIRDCSGTYRFDMSRFAAGLAGGTPAAELSLPGAAIQCQVWCRDPDDPFGSTMSDGLEYVVAP